MANFFPPPPKASKGCGPPLFAAFGNLPVFSPTRISLLLGPRAGAFFWGSLLAVGPEVLRSPRGGPSLLLLWLQACLRGFFVLFGGSHFGGGPLAPGRKFGLSGRPGNPPWVLGSPNCPFFRV